MPVIIGEITSEVVMRPEPDRRSDSGDDANRDGGAGEPSDELVRRVTEEVLARLRLEWGP